MGVLAMFVPLEGTHHQPHQPSSSHPPSEVAAFGATVPLLLGASRRGGRGVFAGAAVPEGREVEVCHWADGDRVSWEPRIHQPIR